MTQDSPLHWNFQAPETLAALVAAADAAGNQALFIAGGQSLVPALARRTSHPACLIDVGRVAELRDICVESDRVKIGAGSSFTDILNSDVPNVLPAVAAALRYVGTHTIRNRATIGGSLAWADPRAELALVLLIHDTTIHTSRRELPISEFVRGPFQSALEPAELIVGISMKSNDGRRRSFTELIDRNSAGKAIVSVAMSLSDGREGSVQLGVAGLVDRPVVSPHLPRGSGEEFTQAMTHWLSKVKTEYLQLADPFHSLEYRFQMASVLSARLNRELGA